MSLDKLSEFRSEIDKIDDEIIALLKARMTVTTHVAEYKKQQGIEILNANREDLILNKVAKHSGEPLAQYTTQIYKEIMSQSRAYQQYLQGLDKRSFHK